MTWVPKNDVVVPVDFSDPSLAAIDTALALVDDPKRVHVIHVLPVMTDYELGMVWSNINDEQRTEQARTAIAERLADAKYKGMQVEIGLGDPGHEIVDYAESIHADLIVMPSHSRSGLTRLLIGSVAERVVRLAHCGVLVLKDPERAARAAPQ